MGLGGAAGRPAGGLEQVHRLQHCHYDSDVLSVGICGHELARQLVKASRKFLPKWYWAMTAQMLPAQLRAAFEFRLDEMDLRSVERGLASLRYLYPLLPAGLRYVGPFHEAKRGWEASAILVY
jgi:hypothetical protein